MSHNVRRKLWAAFVLVMLTAGAVAGAAHGWSADFYGVPARVMLAIFGAIAGAGVAGLAAFLAFVLFVSVVALVALWRLP